MEFKIIRNDIANMKVDAIVLPANSRLREGSGTSNAIFEKAGRKALEKECKRYGKVEVGNSVPTLAYELDAKFILHTVVPKWKNGKQQEYELLSAAYLSALSLADQIQCESMAFPLLASGNNGFDLQLAFEIARESIQSFVPRKKLRKVYLTVYGRSVVSLLENKGFDIEEVVDELYVLQKQNELKLPVERVVEDSIDIAQKFLEDGWDMIKSYLDDPKNRKHILEKSGKIVLSVMDKHGNRFISE